MGLTNFPNGVSSFGVPVIGNPSKVITGKVFFVSSSTENSSDSNKGDQVGRPLATIDAAINLCVADRGDVIYVMPGHSETISTGGGITADIAGVSIIGLGNGNNRPRITFGTSTGADLQVDAANVTLENIIFIAGVDALVGPIDVDAADCSIVNCDFRDTSAYKSVAFVVADANADRLTISGCKARQLTAGATACIEFYGAEDVSIIDCDIVGDYSIANIDNTSLAASTGVATDILIVGNNLDNLNAVDVNIQLVATTDGTIKNNTCRIATDSQVTWITAVNDCQLYENYGVNADAETGKLIGTQSS